MIKNAKKKKKKLKIYLLSKWKAISVYSNAMIKILLAEVTEN